MRTLHRFLSAALLFVGHVHAQGLPPLPVSPTPVTGYEYDAQGNLTKLTRAPGMAGFNQETRATYDRLYRLTDLSDPLQGTTRFTHDGLNRITQVTDPRALATRYVRNGFGQVTQVISPDTGTAELTWSPVNNLVTRTDSRGVVATYRHDPDHRLTGLVYSLGGQSELALGWIYSQTGPDFAYGGGRLTSTRFPAGSSLYRYTGQGRPAATVQRIEPASGANPNAIVHTVGYTYTRGRLTELAYPSGRTLRIGYTKSQATSLTWVEASGAVLPLLGEIRWEPFGTAPRSWNWQLEAGPLAHERWRDLSGRIVRQRLGPVFRDITYDAADRVESYAHWLSDGTPQPGLDQRFGYDGNGRLTRVVTASSSWALSYDASGNRRAVSVNADVRSYTTEATSNRLSSIGNPARTFSHDSAGNMVEADYTATYNLAGQLSSLTRGGITTTYSYDASGRRIRKSAGSADSTLVFVYDHRGQLLGEYDGNGQAVREYVWLGGIPVAVVTTDSSGAPLVRFIHADHLDTPRLVMDRQGVTRWRWLAEPFGTTAPETDPSGLGSFTFPLRFPGQYADTESGLFYNGQRYYDPQTGRYQQSDPIGLVGGINTYSYVGNEPTGYVDPDGLQAAPVPMGPLPLPIPPGAMPGTSENKALTEATIRAIYAARDAVHNVYDRCAQALGRAWDRIFSEGGDGGAGTPDGTISTPASPPPDGDDPTGQKVYRGGDTLEARTNDVRIDKDTGLVKPGRGVSLSSDAEAMAQRFGSAREIVSVPSELRIVRTSGSHFEIAPRAPMTMQRYQELLNQVVMK